jgi:hypothetical protein
LARYCHTIRLLDARLLYDTHFVYVAIVITLTYPVGAVNRFATQQDGVEIDAGERRLSARRRKRAASTRPQIVPSFRARRIPSID